MTSIATAATAASAAGASTSATATASTKIAGDFNTFLKMLTTQLKNQDPTNAMNPTEMTNQLVAFSQVEQQIAMNTNLTSLISLQQAQALTTSADLVGRKVELSGSTLPLQSGAAQVRLPVAGSALAAQVQVVDNNGTVLRNQVVPLGKAATTWSWDGRTDAGTRLPDGAYSYSVSGIGPSGSALPLSATALATVSGVQRQNNALNLMFGPTGVAMEDRKSVV